MEKNDFIKGAVLGGVLGGVAALLFAPKSGRELQEDIQNGYQSVNRQGRCFANNVKEQGHRLLDAFNGTEEDHSHNTLLVGGAIGSVIGALAGLLLAPQPGNQLREQLGEKYEEIREKAESAIDGFNETRHQVGDKFDDWKEFFSTIVEKLSSPKRGKHRTAAIDEIIEWANLGLRLYGQLQKRR